MSNPSGEKASPHLRSVDPPISAPNELMERASSGDQAAFGQLYDQLSPLLYGIVLRIVRDPAMSEEVTQEVFVQLWRSAPSFDSTAGDVRSLAATIARRRAIDCVRSVESSRRRDDAHESDVISAAVATPEKIVVDRDQANSVHNALQRLPELQRESLELAYFGGLTYRAVAERLDVPEGTIKTRIRDGLKRLRQEMEARQ